MGEPPGQVLRLPPIANYLVALNGVQDALRVGGDVLVEEAHALLQRDVADGLEAGAVDEVLEA